MKHVTFVVAIIRILFITKPKNPDFQLTIVAKLSNMTITYLNACGFHVPIFLYRHCLPSQTASSVIAGQIHKKQLS